MSHRSTQCRRVRHLPDAAVQPVVTARRNGGAEAEELEAIVGGLEHGGTGGVGICLI